MESADGNGSYVTRAELHAHLTPIRNDVSEIKDDVKAIRTAQDQSIGASRYRRYLWGFLFAAAGALWWLPQVIHHFQTVTTP